MNSRATSPERPVGLIGTNLRSTRGEATGERRLSVESSTMTDHPPALVSAESRTNAIPPAHFCVGSFDASALSEDGTYTHAPRTSRRGKKRRISGQEGKGGSENRRPAKFDTGGSLLPPASRLDALARLPAIDIASTNPYGDLDRIESIPLRVTARSSVRPSVRSLFQAMSPHASASTYVSRFTKGGSVLHPRARYQDTSTN